jgi:FtsH-binding integral membrane protein
MRKFVRVSINIIWLLISISIAIWLSDSPFLSDDDFLRMIEVKLIMVCTVAFLYGLLFRRTLD